MLSNRIIRALVGVVFAKAAVATGWYLYQKSLEEDNFWGKDRNPFKPEDIKEDSKVQKEVVEEKIEKPIRKSRAKRVVKSETLEKVPEKKKSARKIPVVDSIKEEVVVEKKPTRTKKAKIIKSEA